MSYDTRQTDFTQLDTEINGTTLFDDEMDVGEAVHTWSLTLWEIIDRKIPKKE